MSERASDHRCSPHRLECWESRTRLSTIQISIDGEHWLRCDDQSVTDIIIIIVIIICRPDNEHCRRKTLNFCVEKLTRHTVHIIIYSSHMCKVSLSRFVEFVFEKTTKRNTFCISPHAFDVRIRAHTLNTIYLMLVDPALRCSSCVCERKWHIFIYILFIFILSA